MVDISAALSSELSRIIDCPYPASLIGLADLLAHADAVTVQACIRNRPPCAVSRLAILICEALPLWDYALRVLQCLCQAPEFRYEILLQKPQLLDSLLAKAISSQSDFEQYAELCVFILSHPLPPSISLPAAAHSFFLRIFDGATQDPSVSTLKAVYCMLNGACRPVFGLLPLHARQEFDRQLRLILSSKNTGQDSMLLLWCFGIVLLTEHDDSQHGTASPNTISDNPVTSEGPKRHLKTSSGQKLFSSARASYKAITLTCMSVVWATKSDVGVSVEEAIQVTHIATRILQFVDQNIRESWPKSSDLAEQTFRKLSEKIRNAQTSGPVLLEALSFYATVVGRGKLQPETVTLYQHCLENVTDCTDADLLNETLSRSLPIFVPHIQESAVRVMLTNVLDACIMAPSAHQLIILKTLVDQLSAEIPSCESLRTNMLSSFSGNILQKKLWSIAQSTPTIEESACHSYAVSLHQQLVPATIALILTLGCAGSGNELKLPNDLMIALINKERNLPSNVRQCFHLMAAPEQPSVSLFQQACTQYTGQHLQDWRSRLKLELDSQGSYQRDLIVRSVAQICQDLETRCETVEEPLRREKVRAEELEGQVNSLTERIAFLETEKIDYRLHLEGIEEEKENLAHEKDELFAKFESMKFELSGTRKHAAETLRTVREELQAKAQELQSTVLRQGEDERSYHRNLDVLNGTLLELKQAREKQELDNCTLTEQYECLQTQLNTTKGLLEREQQGALDMVQKITRLETQSFDLENQLRGVEEDLETTLRKLSNLEVSRQELIRASEDQLRKTEIKHQHEVEIAAEKAEKERSELDNQLQTALQTSQRLKESYEGVQRDLEHLQICVPNLEAKAQDLKDLCSEQEEELEELRTLRSNVLKSFGLTSQRPLAIRTHSGARNELTEPNSPPKPREHRRRKSSVHAQRSVPIHTSTPLEVLSTTMENTTNASLTSSDSQDSQCGGSTPKRLKPRQEFKIPTMRTSYTQKPLLKSTSISNRSSPKKRSALMQTSPNRRHTTVGFAMTTDEEEHRADGVKSARKRRGSLQDVDQEDFDMEEFLTGTGKIPEEEDVTTTGL